eukprot:scaffold1673_cov99-Skeletonema_dohrnii-CCMP3373.AAC.4
MADGQNFSAEIQGFFFLRGFCTRVLHTGRVSKWTPAYEQSMTWHGGGRAFAQWRCWTISNKYPALGVLLALSISAVGGEVLQI